jgi:mannosyl-oligosaccharide alpha-1,2-mannosidase
MGFTDEYHLCRPHVNQLNFNWVNGRDWADGYIAEAVPEDGKRPPWEIGRDSGVGLPVFETGIRYLGGLLGAYDLSGDELMLERAVDIATVLARAFDTESGLPAGRIDPGSELGYYRIFQVSLAEVGSMTLELIRLSQATGNRTWFDLAQRATDFLDQKVAPRSIFAPLLPTWINPGKGTDSSMVTGSFTFGGLADSYYEYLVKAYKLLGGSPIAQQYKRLYEESIDRARSLLWVNLDHLEPHLDLFTIGKLEHGQLVPETEHLTCFAGAMLGLGARLLSRPKDLVDAQRFTQTCYWLSAATATGLQPESVGFYRKEDGAYENTTLNGAPVWVQDGRAPLDWGKVHEDKEGVVRWNEGGEAVDRDGEEYVRRLKGALPGGKIVNGRGINRPETIE